MAKSKSHLLYQKAPEGTAVFRYSKRGGNNKVKFDTNIYTQKYELFVSNYQRAFDNRERERNPDLNIPLKVICVEMEFWSWFNSSEFEIRYRQDFGITPVRFNDLNTRALFAVVDERLFDNFIGQLKAYVRCKDHNRPDYNVNIKYIKDFKFHGTADILSNLEGAEQTVYLNLIDALELDKASLLLIDALEDYLNERGITYNFSAESNQFEFTGISRDVLVEIAQNFDVVHNINSHSYMVTKPDRFGTNIRTYPFDIEAESDEMPTIGIIDTGVDAGTPLSKILIRDNSFGIGGLNPLVDDADEGYGHGTSVAALAALGPQLAGEIEGTLYASANILSIKVLANFSGSIRNSDIVELIRRAHREYGVRIFTLTICYSNPLRTGESHSDYAFMLDKLSFELDILICICTANGGFDSRTIHNEYPRHFLLETANFCTPADSMNNLTVGATGDNLEPEMPISRVKYPFSSSLHPAVYTRKYHIDYESLTVKNRNSVKPDVVYAGGNYTCIVDEFGINMDSSFEAGIRIITPSRLNPVMRSVGTSFATPLISNMAARILLRYPTLRLQSIKALIINSAVNAKLGLGFGQLKKHETRFITGHGTPNLEQALDSDENQVTLVFQDRIGIDQVKSMPVQFPTYLNKLGDANQILQVTATLCYSFQPLQNNQLAYCPANLAFGFFRNVALRDDQPAVKNGKNITEYKGISGGSSDTVALVKSFVWSQDAWVRSKVLSNTQKISFNISKSQLVNEQNIIKIGVQCHFHKILPAHVTASLPKEYDYSLVVSIEETPKGANLTGRLYDGLKNLNDLVAVADLDTGLDAEGEDEAILE